MTDVAEPPLRCPQCLKPHLFNQVERLVDPRDGESYRYVSEVLYRPAYRITSCSCLVDGGEFILAENVVTVRTHNWQRAA